jgi:hypothetical protein
MIVWMVPAAIRGAGAMRPGADMTAAEAKARASGWLGN